MLKGFMMALRIGALRQWPIARRLSMCWQLI
jgi:hypothetical protein